MEQQLDTFTQRRFELMIEMSTKKLQQEIAALKEHVSSLGSEIGSLRSQLTRMQFQPQQSHHNAPAQVQAAEPEYEEPQAKNNAEIVDCRPHDERKKEFVSGAARNAEPIRPRFGDYEPKDVSIDKFFYFGRK